tara:strand:- start:136 stop:651 length:516 start_codon:yes stop_codon:yes gene_type:complete
MSTGWMLPDEVMNYIFTNVSKGSTILEFGSGQGSVNLSMQYNLISVEHNEEWIGLSSGEYIHAEIVENPISTRFGQKGWYDSEKLLNLPSFVDVIIIDGPPGDVGRIGILDHLELLPSFSICIVDDTDREEESLLLEKLMPVLDFKDQIEIMSSSRRGNGKLRKSTVLVRG